MFACLLYLAQARDAVRTPTLPCDGYSLDDVVKDAACYCGIGGIAYVGDHCLAKSNKITPQCTYIPYICEVDDAGAC